MCFIMKLPYITVLCLFVVFKFCNAEELGIGDLFPIGYYRAAVLELKQYNDDSSSGRELIDINLGKYTKAAELAKSNKVDIIVFPEKGMFPMRADNATWFLNYGEDIPDGSANANPCKDKKFSNSPILRNLSCIAQKNSFFVVATFFDVKKCEVQRNCNNRVNKNSCVTDNSDCPDGGYFYFNTLVVFNRQGTLVARYYKRHPFTPLETQQVAVPRYPEPAYFNMGLTTFATDIGFDFLFNSSVMDVEKRPWTAGITYGNWWFDHTPLFYFAIPNQQAWSLTNKVTVLSSDVHAPNLGSLGSGIYLPKKGAVIYSYNPDGKSKLLISNVPTSPLNSILDTSLNTKFFYINDDDTVTELNGEEPRDFKEECSEDVLGMNPTSLTDYRCKNSEVEQYTFAKLNETEDKINICSNNFCCSLEYQAESMDETFYFAVSGNRLKFYDRYWFGVQSCFLARCEPVDGKPCRNFLLKSNTKFKSFKMTGKFDTKYIYPHILDSELRLPDRDEWSFDGKSQLSYKNLKGKEFLYADIYGRKYEEDGLVEN